MQKCDQFCKPGIMTKPAYLVFLLLQLPPLQQENHSIWPTCRLCEMLKKSDEDIVKYLCEMVWILNKY